MLYMYMYLHIRYFYVTLLHVHVHCHETHVFILLIHWVRRLRTHLMLSQDLTVTVTSERGEHEVELLEDKEEISVINVEAFIDDQVGCVFLAMYLCVHVSLCVYQSHADNDGL